MIENINDINSPELGPDNLVWLTEMGINYGLLKTYQPQITKSTKTVAASGAKTFTDNNNSHENVENIIAHAHPHVQSPKRIGSLAKDILQQARQQDGLANKADSPIQIKDESIQAQDLQTLQQMAAGCVKCQLHKQRDKIVFGFGNEDKPDIMIIGEAPGRADDACGYPFQGKAGQLLHFMLLSVGIHPNNINLGPRPLPLTKHSKACDMYFANLVKCRPMGNRSPDELEIKQCYPYLAAQIAMIKPKCILVMGSLAAKYLLNQNKTLEQLRAKIHYVDIDGLKIPLIATWHPASLLLQPQNKPLAWADLQMLKGFIADT